MKKTAAALLAASLLFLTACAQTGGAIGTGLSLCCPGNYENYHIYGLETENMPVFLRDYVSAEFDRAFQAKGLLRNDHSNDLRIVLRYNHINLAPEQQEIDPFIRIEALSVELHYVAEIQVEMYETRSDELVWAGTISRIHQVVPGEYMHEERARPAFQQAFSALLENYPAP